MRVDWSWAFEYEKFRFLHVKQTAGEGIQIVLNISKCRGDGREQKALEVTYVATSCAAVF